MIDIIYLYSIPHMYGENDNIYEEEEESCYFENFYFETMIIIKLLIIVFSTYCFILFFMNYLNFWLEHFFFILFFIIMTILSIALNFPMFYRNRKIFGFFCCNCGKFESKNNIFCTNIEYTLKFLKHHVASFSGFISNVIFF